MIGDAYCEVCGLKLLVPYDFSGMGLGVVVCFRCEPPTILCQRCSKNHKMCRNVETKETKRK